MAFQLDDFDRLKFLDGTSLRRELGKVRSANRIGSEGKPIADDTWRDWRLLAGVDRGVVFINQYQAVLICYQAFYSFSGKRLNGGKVLKSVTADELPELVDAWLRSVAHPRIKEILEMILYVGMTAEQLEDEQLRTYRRTRSIPAPSRIYQNRLKRYLASRSRPRVQRFIREIVCRTVLKPQ